MQEIEFNQPQSVDADDKKSIILPSGTRVKISHYYIDFYDGLLNLSPADKIELLQLDYNDVIKYLEHKKQVEINQAISLLKAKWVDTAYDCPIDMECDYDVFEIPLSQMLKKLKSKSKATVDDARLVIQFLSSNEWKQVITKTL